MTHGGMFSFVPTELLVLFVMGLIVLGPAAFASHTLYEHGYRATSTVWAFFAAVLYLPSAHLFNRATELQQQAAREANCMGYTESGFPERCLDALAAAPEPEGFTLVVGSALTLSAVSLFAMLVYGYAGSLRDIAARIHNLASVARRN